MAWLPCDESVQGKAGRGRLPKCALLTVMRACKVEPETHRALAALAGGARIPTKEDRWLEVRSGLAERGSSSQPCFATREALPYKRLSTFYTLPE